MAGWKRELQRELASLQVMNDDDAGNYDDDEKDDDDNHRP